MKKLFILLFFAIILNQGLLAIKQAETVSNINKKLLELMDDKPNREDLNADKLSHISLKNNRKPLKTLYDKNIRYYDKLKNKYDRLLSLYKSKGYLSSERPNTFIEQFNRLYLPKHRTKKLKKLPGLIKEKPRKLKKNYQIYHLHNAKPKNSRRKWLKSAAQKTANVFGIKNNYDFLTATAGVGALGYGVYHSKKTKKERHNKSLKTLQSLKLKEAQSKMLNQEISGLTSLNELIDATSRKISSTADNICNGIDRRISFSGDTMPLFM